MKGKIKVECFLRDGETLVPTEDLSPVQREKLASWLNETYLNELCRGQAVFSAAEEMTSLTDVGKTEGQPLGFPSGGSWHRR